MHRWTCSSLHQYMWQFYLGPTRCPRRPTTWSDCRATSPGPQVEASLRTIRWDFFSLGNGEQGKGPTWRWATCQTHGEPTQWEPQHSSMAQCPLHPPWATQGQDWVLRRKGEDTCIQCCVRSFCLFVILDLLFVTLLWIIELNVNGNIPSPEKELMPSNYDSSYEDMNCFGSGCPSLHSYLPVLRFDFWIS